jgi:hypothetical protein
MKKLIIPVTVLALSLGLTGCETREIRKVPPDQTTNVNVRENTRDEPEVEEEVEVDEVDVESDVDLDTNEDRPSQSSFFRESEQDRSSTQPTNSSSRSQPTTYHQDYQQKRNLRENLSHDYQEAKNQLKQYQDQKGHR